MNLIPPSVSRDEIELVAKDTQSACLSQRTRLETVVAPPLCLQLETDMNKLQSQITEMTTKLNAAQLEKQDQQMPSVETCKSDLQFIQRSNSQQKIDELQRSSSLQYQRRLIFTKSDCKSAALKQLT